MQKMLTKLVAAAAIAGTMAAAASTDAVAQRGRWVGPAIGLGILGGVVAGSILATRPRGYVAYEGYGQPVYGSGCYWARQPLYDRWGHVVGYTGRPVQVCP